MREPGPRTMIPTAVLIKRTGEEIPVRGHPITVALVSAIAEDFQELNPNGSTDVVSAAANASLTLAVVEAAGLRLVDAGDVDLADDALQACRLALIALDLDGHAEAAVILSRLVYRLIEGGARDPSEEGGERR